MRPAHKQVPLVHFYSSREVASSQAVDPLPRTKPVELRVLWDNLYKMDEEDRLIISRPPSEKFAIQSF